MDTSEKEQLAAVMERYGIEWEHKGTHEKHLDVLDYKVQERSKEIETFEAKIATKQDEVKSLSARVDNFSKGLAELQKVEQALNTDAVFQLPEPQGLMTAKSYKTKVAEPLVKKLKSLIKRVLARCFEAMDSYHRLNVTNANLYRENEKLSKVNDHLKGENDSLRSENRDYKLLRKVFDGKQIDTLLEQESSLNSVINALEIFKMKGRKIQ